MPHSLFSFFPSSNHDFLFILFIETKPRMKHNRRKLLRKLLRRTTGKEPFPQICIIASFSYTPTIDIPLVHTFSTTSAPLPPAPPSRKNSRDLPTRESSLCPLLRLPLSRAGSKTRKKE